MKNRADLTHAQLTRRLWAAMEVASVDQYPQVIAQGIHDGGFSANDALWFPLSHCMEHRMGNMAHVNAASPGVSRDLRLKAWFQAAVDLGGEPLMVISGASEHACGGFSRLVKMKCHETLKWWQEQGAEMKFQGPAAFKGEPTNFATLACLMGQLGSVNALLTGTKLTHVDQLWLNAWSKKSVAMCEAITGLLEIHGPVPSGCIAEFAAAPVNLNNIDQVLASGKRLLRLGSPIDEVDRKGLTPLARAVRMLNSPASVSLISFLLEQGADPLAPAGKHTVLEDALDLWIQCSTRSHLRSVRHDVFCILANACAPQILSEMFPVGRQEDIEEKIRSTRQAGSPYSLTTSDWDPGAEIARMQSFWMNLALSTTENNAPVGRSRARL